MGNSRSDSEADYALYGRPKNGQLRESRQVQDSVQIIDDGGAAASGGGAGSIGGSAAGREAGHARISDPGDQPGDDGVRGPEVPGRSASEGPPDGPYRRRFNPYLLVAWGLVAAVLAAGLTWLTGALEPPTYFSVNPSTGEGMDRGQSVVAMNLYSMGPFLLLFGLMGAFTLLAVQASAFRRRPGR